MCLGCDSRLNAQAAIEFAFNFCIGPRFESFRGDRQLFPIRLANRANGRPALLLT